MTLSYAEVKALTTGNPLIIERCDLDTEVQKLKMLKTNYLNEKYDLENKLLKDFPNKISHLQGLIAGCTADIALREKHTPVLSDTFPGMKIKDAVCKEKSEAGDKLLQAFSNIHTADPVVIGEYKGFKMSIVFEPFCKEYHLSLQGTLSHKVYFGSDIYGNIARINNVLDGLEEQRSKYQNSLENTKKQFEEAKQEVKKPFSQEQELTEKTKRLEEVTRLLNAPGGFQTAQPTASDANSPEHPDRSIVALESTEDYSDAKIGFLDYHYPDGKIAHRYRLVRVGTDGKLQRYPGMPEPFFLNQYVARKFISEHDELTVIPYEEMLGFATEHSMEQRTASQPDFESNPKPQDDDLEFA